MLNLCINHKDVSFVINEDIARYYVPNLVLAVPETPLFGSLFKAEGSHIGINHYLRGRMGVGNYWLNNDWLDSTTVKPSKTIERISCFREKNVVHQ